MEFTRSNNKTKRLFAKIRWVLESDLSLGQVKDSIILGIESDRVYLQCDS